MSEDKPKVTRGGDRRKGSDPDYEGPERRVGERRQTGDQPPPKRP